jgi:hypothetical protein
MPRKRQGNKTEISRAERMVTSLAIAMLAAGFAAGGFQALADTRLPLSHVHFGDTSAHVPQCHSGSTRLRPVASW